MSSRVMRHRVRAAARRRPLITFLLLTFSISWLLWPMAGAELAPIPIGPLLGAILTAALIGGPAALRDLLGRMVRWRVRTRWYALALGVPAAVIGAAVLIAFAGGATAAPGPQTRWYLAAPLVLVAIVSPLQGALGEELGWRGYLLPRAQHHRSALTAALVVGVVQVAWHLPLFVTGAYGLSNVVFQLAFAIIVAWVFNSTRGSVLLCMVVHGAFNGLVGFAAPLLAEPDRPSLMWALAATSWVAALAVVAIAGPRHLTRSGPRDAEPVRPAPAPPTSARDPQPAPTPVP